MLRRARQDSLRIHHALPGCPIFDWPTQVSKIFVTGHSMGGSLAMMFSCIIRGWSEAMSALPEGKSLGLVGRVMTRLADDKVEVRLTDAPCGAPRPTVVLPLSMLVAVPKTTELACYVYSATKPGNFGLKKLHDSYVPNTFNTAYECDMMAPLITPWSWHPGHRIDLIIKEGGYRACKGSSSTWLAGSKLAQFLIAGVDLHGPDAQGWSAIMVKHFRNQGASTCWDKLGHFVLVEKHFNPQGWLRAHPEDDLTDEITQERLLMKGTEIKDGDFAVRVSGPARNSSNFLLALFCLFFLAPLLVLSSVALLVFVVVLLILLIFKVLRDMLFANLLHC